MDKEQIMIDGVDVSECAYFDYENEGTTDCDAYGNECEANNCYFKQFARKTQECDTLKSQLDFEVQQKECIKQECEELKEENQKLEMQLCNNCGERDDYNIPCKMIRDLDYGLQKEIEENDRYRKALEEIEEYCDKQIAVTGDLPFKTTESDILDIINKVKGEGNDT